MTRNVSQDEGGWILIICVVMTSVLAMVGLLVVQGVWVNAKTFGAQRNAEAARYIAEAGISWAIEELNTNADYRKGETELDYQNLLSLQTISQLGDDTECTAQLIRDQESCYPAELGNWRRLHQGATMEESGPVIPYAGGELRVVIRDDVDGDGDFNQDSNGQLLVRAYGVSLRGARSMVEIAVSDQTGVCAQ
ncbi:MAG: hypothetical protein VX834_12195 [Myxococcota bacterium]|nr:hypothetical protein [Myxococcota bacterium]